LILGIDSEVLKCITIKQAQEARYRSDKQIMKPEGQAGWGSGYTLELAMGLENEHFLKIQVSNRLYIWIYAAKKALGTRKNIYICLPRHTVKSEPQLLPTSVAEKRERAEDLVSESQQSKRRKLETGALYGFILKVCDIFYSQNAKLIHAVATCIPFAFPSFTVAS